MQSEKNNPKANQLLLLVSATSLSTLVFIIDLSTPLGVAGGVPYIAVLLTSLFTKRMRDVLTLGVTSTLLTIIGLFLSEPYVTFWIVILNRLYAVAAIWLVVIVLFFLYKNIRKLKHQSENDYLTGLKNRLYLYEAGDKMIKTCERNGSSASLIMFDIDDFKHINDCYGHKSGDQVLINVAKICEEFIPKSNAIARIGGEEFAIILPTIGIREAYECADILRRQFQKHTIKQFDGDAEIKFTASFGVSEMNPKGESITLLLHKADIALYKAKHLGKDTCQTHKGFEKISD